MLTPDYPQFVPADTPADNLTVSAWKGEIRPFETDAAAAPILADMEAERQLSISEGTILASSATSKHWALPLLVNMNVFCEVLLCLQAEAMPRAYLLSPCFNPWYADTLIHPHPRGDHSIKYKGRPLPGLCVFSSAETIFQENENFYTQFLDQLTQYVAKHLVWLRTRRLCRLINGKLTVLYQPRPGESIVEGPPRVQLLQTPTGQVQAVDFWKGYWPGKSARATTPAEHLRHIKPSQRCWCGLNKGYGECHRPEDLLLVQKLNGKEHQGASALA